MTNSFPVAATTHLPITGIGHSALPVIFVQNEKTGGIELFTEALEWASVLSAHLKTISVRKHVTTLCNFVNFYNLYSEGQDMSVNAQSMSVLAYLDFRISGTEHLDLDNPLHPLGWRGCAKTSVRTEFKYLTRFFRWLEEHIGDGAKTIDQRLFRLPQKSIQKFHSLDKRDFFLHLSSHRKHWEDLTTDDSLLMPRRFKPAGRENGFRPFPPAEEIRAIIAAEQNPAFKALWLLQSYGASHRVSEVLNIWQEDILPPSYSKEFFGLPSNGLPVVLIAHPSESTWLGHFTSGKTNRLQYLLTKYNFRPRSERDSSDPLYAGYKGKRVFGLHKTANTWWLNPDAAVAFQACVDEIEAFHRRNKTSVSHPYFFVNMFAKDYRRGEPITKKRIESAWEAACKRVGLQAHDRGRNIHGLRHFQKWLAEQMGIPKSQIQIIRGDNSAASQDEYGICASTVAIALQATNNKQTEG